MNWYRIGLTLVVLGAILLATPVAALAGTTSADTTQEQSQDDQTITPGERLSGVVAAQQAELDGEIEERTFEIKVQNASDDNETADIVSEKIEEVQTRLETLDQRLERLQESVENGSLSRGTYAARAAEVEAERASVERVADDANETATGLRADVLREKGLNVTAIRTLKNRADELSGPEVARIARSIAGPDVGEDIGNRSEEAREEARERAEEAREEAEEAREEARERAEEAREEAEEAREEAEDAPGNDSDDDADEPPVDEDEDETNDTESGEDADDDEAGRETREETDTRGTTDERSEG
jgi:hypothetical protein